MSAIGAALRRALDRLRAPPASAPDPDALVTVPLGGDPFEAEVMAAACRTAGAHVELLVSEMGQHPAGAGVQQLLLVRPAEVDLVRSILAAHLRPPAGGGPD